MFKSICSYIYIYMYVYVSISIYNKSIRVYIFLYFSMLIYLYLYTINMLKPAKQPLWTFFQAPGHSKTQTQPCANFWGAAITHCFKNVSVRPVKATEFIQWLFYFQLPTRTFATAWGVWWPALACTKAWISAASSTCAGPRAWTGSWGGVLQRDAFFRSPQVHLIDLV